MAHAEPHAMPTSRLESFSDGVIAVAATLLVLGLVVPDSGDLAHELGKRWPSYAAYAVSFITIGIIWVNHHVMIGRLREADHPILMLNLLLLVTIGLLPFATHLLAAYLTKPRGGHLAAAIYAGAFLLMAIVFSVLNWHILMRKARLLRTEMPYAVRRQILARALSGLAPYAVATGLAFVSQYATLAICGAVALFYALPVASGLTRERGSR